jgi:hypothetical protein
MLRREAAPSFARSGCQPWPGHACTFLAGVRITAIAHLEDLFCDSFQHERVTLADREAEARARALHRGPTPVAVSHLVAVRGTAEKNNVAHAE